jgi:hypothetical protein
MNALRSITGAILLAGASAFAIGVGETAPLCTLSTHGGGTFNLAQQQGTVVVLYFFTCG